MQARLTRGVSIPLQPRPGFLRRASGALAEGPVRGRSGGKDGMRHHGARGLLRAAAAYIQLTPRAVRAELRAGKSLAQVAADHGKSVDGLKQAILSAAKPRIDKAVTAGRLGSEDATVRLAKLESKLDTLVNKKRPAK